MQVAVATIFVFTSCEFPVGAFVGAACRSLTPAQRMRSVWRMTSGAAEGTGAFVGELEGSLALAIVDCDTRMLIKRLFEV